MGNAARRFLARRLRQAANANAEAARVAEAKLALIRERPDLLERMMDKAEARTHEPA